MIHDEASFGRVVGRTLRNSESLLVMILFVVLTSMYFWRVVFGGYVFSPTDMIFDFSFFRDIAPAGYQYPTNGLLSDAVLKFYPWHTVVRESLQNQQFPSWNPYIYAGTPLFANAESAVLYPLNVLGYLLPLNTALTVSAVTRVLIAGIGTFLFLKSQRIGNAPAVLAAVTFMFSGSMMVWLNYPVGNAYAWLPWHFYLGEKLLVSRRLSFVGLIALCIATQILGGHYQTSFIMLLAVGLFIAYRITRDYHSNRERRQLVHNIILFSIAVILGFVLVAVQLIPFASWLGQTNEAQFRIQDRSLSLLNPDFLPGAIVVLVTLAMPNFFGNPTWGVSDSFFYSNYVEQTVYVGIVPLTLAGLVVLSALRKANPQNAAADSVVDRGSVLFMSALGLFFLALAVHLPIIDLLNSLPFFNLVSAGRYRLVFTFCVAVLAGIGAERIIRLPQIARLLQRLTSILITFAILGAITILAIAWILTKFKDNLVSFDRFASIYPVLQEAFQIRNLDTTFPLLIALLFAGSLWMYRTNRISRQVLTGFLLTLSFLDLLLLGMAFNPVIPESQIFPLSRPAQFLDSAIADTDFTRVLALHDTLPPNTGTPYHLSDLAGSDYPSRRYIELAQAMGGTLIGARNRIYFPVVPPSHLLNMMNVGYIIAYTGFDDIPTNSLGKIFDNEYVEIYANRNVLPRAFTVHEYLVVDDDTQILNTLRSSSFDPTREIVLEELPPVEISESNSLGNDSVQIVQYQSQKVTIRVEMAHEGFLFMSDAYYPGWQAFVDSKEVRIYRANYAFRSVYLPAGEHTVEFVYTPPGFYLGLELSLAGLGVTIVIIVLGWKRRLYLTRWEQFAPIRKKKTGSGADIEAFCN